MILTLDGDLHVEDDSGQGMEIEGIRWSENRVFPSGIRWGRAAPLRRPQRLWHGLTSIDATHPVDGVWWSLARLQGLPRERGPPPAVARGEGDWRALETVGDIRRGQVWTKTDRFWDLGGSCGRWDGL